MREADVGSQSADTIKLDFSSCLGRKQKTRQREPAGPWARTWARAPVARYHL